MTSLVELSFSPAFLTHCFNAALASTVACAMAIALGRRQAWSLPVRHGMLVAALVVSLAAPLLMPLVDPPSLFTVELAEKVDGSRASAEPTEAAAVRPRPLSESSDSTPVTFTANEDPQTITPLAASAPVPAVASVSRPAPVPKRPRLSATELLRPVGTLVCMVWLAGIFFATGRAIVFLVRFKRWQQTIVTADSAPLLEAARWAARRAGLRHEIAVFRCDVLPAPVTFGLFRPRVAVPDDIESGLTLDQLRVVLLHEMAHIARRDLWTGLLQQANQLLMWWNPLVRIVNRRLSDLREQICDDIATRELPLAREYAATLVQIAERCVERLPVPATLGIGSSPGQLEIRIRRIVSSPRAKCFRLNGRAAIGVSIAAVLMAATALSAQVRVGPGNRPAGDLNAAGGGADDASAGSAAPTDKPDRQVQPSLADLVDRIAAYERAYMPYEVKVMNTFRMSDGLSPRQRAKYPWADGHKHQRLMEYAQLKPRVWRTKETHLLDDVAGRPSESYSDGNRLIQVTRYDANRGDGSEKLRVVINHSGNAIQPYLFAEPLNGVFCLSGYSTAVLLSEAARDGRVENLKLDWQEGDAKLSFPFGPSKLISRFELWLSRNHGWHPIRLRRFYGDDKQFFDEWEVTKFVERDGQWHVAAGTHHYRDFEEKSLPDSKVVYSTDFTVLAAAYGKAVDEKQFQYQIPAEAEVEDDEKPAVEPPPPAETREITVRVVDVADRPVPNARVKFRAVQTLQQYDLVTTDEQGLTRSSKAPRDYVSLEIEADGFRPAGWIMGTGGKNELRAFLIPNSPGWTVDERNRPVADAWVNNEPTKFRADGIVSVPGRYRHDKGGWSSSDGAFELHSELTVRRPDALLPYIAVDEEQEMMAIEFLRADRLGQPQTLVLQPVHRVQGHFLLKGITIGLMKVGLTLETPTGERIAGVNTKHELTSDGLRLDFQLRLPPGEYVLKSRASSQHAGFTTSFSVKADDGDLDLGMKAVPATGLVALRGKPAPELEVAWRAGQETTWEKLRGKVVVLDFWGTWCIPCIAAMPMLMDIREQFHDQPVEWLTIHTANVKDFDELDQTLTTCQERNWNDRVLPFTTLIDLPAPDETYSGKTSQRYGIAEWPTLVVVDQQGKIVGAVEKEKLAETIRRLVEQASDSQ